MLPLEPSDDPDIRRQQLEDALSWCLEMLCGFGIGYLPGDALLDAAPPTGSSKPKEKYVPTAKEVKTYFARKLNRRRIK